MSNPWDRPEETKATGNPWDRPAAPAEKAQPAQDLGGFLGSSASKAIAGAVGGPVDLARLGIDAGKYVANKFGANLAPQTKPDVGGSQYIEDKMRQVGMINQSGDPRNNVQRFAQNTIGALPMLAGGGSSKALKTAGQIADLPGKGLAAAGDAALTGASKVLPKVDADTAKLAREAHDMGFRLRPDQVYPGQTGKFLGEASSHVPASGSTTQANKAVFNQKLADLAGIDGKNMTRENFAKAIEKHGSEIGNIMEKTDSPITQDFVDKISSIAKEASQFKNADAQKSVASVLDRLRDQSNGSMIPGKVAKSIHSDIGKAMKGTDNMEKRTALGEIQDALHEHVKSNMTAEDAAALDKARGHYYTLKTIEPLAAKANGDVSPALLQQALQNKVGASQIAQGKAGELGKLADIGAKFLKDPKSSGTAERIAAMGLVPGMIASPASGMASLGAANLYNRVGPKLTKRLIDRPPQ